MNWLLLRVKPSCFNCRLSLYIVWADVFLMDLSVFWDSLQLLYVFFSQFYFEWKRHSAAATYNLALWFRKKHFIHSVFSITKKSPKDVSWNWGGSVHKSRTKMQTYPDLSFVIMLKQYLSQMSYLFPLLSHLCPEVLFRNGQISPDSVTRPCLKTQECEFRPISMMRKVQRTTS